MLLWVNIYALLLLSSPVSVSFVWTPWQGCMGEDALCWVWFLEGKGMVAVRTWVDLVTSGTLPSMSWAMCPLETAQIRNVLVGTWPFLVVRSLGEQISWFPLSQLLLATCGLPSWKRASVFNTPAVNAQKICLWYYKKPSKVYFCLLGFGGREPQWGSYVSRSHWILLLIWFKCFSHFILCWLTTGSLNFKDQCYWVK